MYIIIDGTVSFDLDMKDTQLTNQEIKELGADVGKSDIVNQFNSFKHKHNLFGAQQANLEYERLNAQRFRKTTVAAARPSALIGGLRDKNALNKTHNGGVKTRKTVAYTDYTGLTNTLARSTTDAGGGSRSR